METKKPQVDAYAETKGTTRTGEEGEPSGAGLGLLVSCEAGVFVVPLREGARLVLGRVPECDVSIADGSISRTHARLTLAARASGEEIQLEDLGSTNGTKVQGRRLAKGEVASIGIGSVFELGSATCVLQKLRGLPRQPGARDVAIARGGEITLSEREDDDGGPIVCDPTMRNLYALLDLVAPSALSVLVLGETGVGKELYAAAVHQRSPRASGPFLQLNCASLPESILEGELFGFEKGAFTGAIQAKAGLFESADGGTVFLDEVGELPLSTQAKLLRVIESGEVMRLGSLKPKRVDVRFVSATNRDVRALVAEGKFRSDLYFRLDGISITLPPLRSRSADIAPIARRFARQAAAKLGKEIAFTSKALRALERHTWPGNVRELKNVIERAVVLSTRKEIDVAELITADPTAFGRPVDEPATERVESPRGPLDTLVPPRDLKDELKSIEKERILDALARAAGNQNQAAKLLGMSRYTLIARIEEYGLARPRKK